MPQENIPKKRHTAFNLSIEQINNAKYVSNTNTPDFLETSENQKAYRINLIAIAIGIQNRALILDDGTSQINLISFDQEPNKQLIGKTVLTIAKIRSFQNNKYLVPEIIKEIDHGWLMLRQKELKKATTQKNTNQKPLTSHQKPEPEVKKEKNQDKEKLTEQILFLIKLLDKGQGVPIDSLIEQVNDTKTESIINFLLLQGEIYEISPGCVKLLD